MFSISDLFKTTRNRMGKIYYDTPLLYKIYVVTSGITYAYFPQTQNTILVNTGTLIGAELIEHAEKYVKEQYPDKLVLCDTLSTANIICKIGALGYVSSQMESLVTLHTSFVKFGYIVNSFLLKSVINGAYYSAVYGSVVSFSTWCCVKIFRNTIPTLIESGIAQIVEAIRSQLTNDGGQIMANFIGMLDGLFPQAKKVLTIQQLDTIAPVKCIGLNNCTEFTPICCSTCLDNFDHKTLHRTLPCRHSFHPSCIEKWLLESSTVCPMCRANTYDLLVINN